MALPPGICMADNPNRALSDSPRFERWLSAVRRQVTEAGVSPAAFDRVTAGLQADPQVLEFATAQPEHARAPWDYVSALVSERRIKAGQEKRTNLAGLLEAIETTYGVDRNILLAIWGIESNFGESTGGRSVFRSLATLAAYDERRRGFWLSELVAAFKVVDGGRVEPESMTGSWAGAGGHTQFMPSTYLAHAVDFDKDGRADIWGSVADALASTAHYLKASGWRTGGVWGFEVVLPAGIDYALSAPGGEEPLAFWRNLGLERPGARPLSDTTLPLSLLLPAGAGGPAFLVTANFRAILRYNPAVVYALAVGHLADRIARPGPLAGPLPGREKSVGGGRREEVERLFYAARGCDRGTHGVLS